MLTVRCLQSSHLADEQGSFLLSIRGQTTLIDLCPTIVSRQRQEFDYEPLADIIEESNVLLMSTAESLCTLAFIALGCRINVFNKTLLATVPVVEFGRMLALELKECSKIVQPTVSTASVPDKVSTKKPLKRLRNSPYFTQPHWTAISADSLNAFFDRISSLHFRQRVMVGNSGLVIEPRCSGNALGSANWLFDFPAARRRLFYFGHSSITLGTSISPVADLDHLTTHAQSSVDCCIVGTQRVAVNSAAEFCEQLTRLLANCTQQRKQFKLIIPCKTVSQLLELCLELGCQMESGGRKYALSSIPIFFISPQAKRILLYANNLSEWAASPSTGAKDAEGAGDFGTEPFPFDRWLKSNRLLIASHFGHPEAHRVSQAVLFVHDCHPHALPPSIRQLGDSVGDENSGYFIFHPPPVPAISSPKDVLSRLTMLCRPKHLLLPPSMTSVNRLGAGRVLSLNCKHYAYADMVGGRGGDDELNIPLDWCYFEGRLLVDRTDERQVEFINQLVTGEGGVCHTVDASLSLSQQGVYELALCDANVKL